MLSHLQSPSEPNKGNWKLDLDNIVEEMQLIWTQQRELKAYAHNEHSRMLLNENPTKGIESYMPYFKLV